MKGAIVCVCVCMSRRLHARLSRTRSRDVCRSNRLYNEMSACSLLMEKYWMNVSSIVLLSKGRPVCSRWIAKGSYSDRETRPSAHGENTRPFAIQRETSLFRWGIECSWHRFMEYQFNDRDFTRLSGLEFPP